MAAIRSLILLAFLASTGVTFLVLGCALQQYNVWWPMFVIVFYLLSPFPTLVARRFSVDGEERSSALFEVCCFITTCIVLSSYGLPIILARKSIIEWGACGFVMAGNAVIFVAIFLLFYFFTREDDSFEYSTW